MVQEVRVGIQPLERFREVVASTQMHEAMQVAATLRGRLAKRVLWNVNSTAVGGGVAEMLPPLLSYARSIGIDARWMVIEGNPEFFRVTKRLHHALHGSLGDGSPLGEAEHRIYRDTLFENARQLASLIRPRDVVILHDPQTAGLAPALKSSGAHLIWRCHIGHDIPGEEVDKGWEFLRRYLEHIPAFVFSRRAYVPAAIAHTKSTIIQPSIDAFSPKNQELDEETVRAILVYANLVDGPAPADGAAVFERDDGTPSRVERQAKVVRSGRPPAWDTPLVLQVSRWDPLKDMTGVMHGFLKLAQVGCPVPAELVLAAPDVSAVADDPEGARVFEEVKSAWRELPDDLRDRVHLASLPMADVQENAAIVNALQRHANVVVQKSLHEGFGLTVAEAMWKARPVVASAVGGIQDQIEHGVNGLLLGDPRDLDGFASAVCSLLCEPETGARMGTAARERVRKDFLGVGHLLKYADLIKRLDG